MTVLAHPQSSILPDTQLQGKVEDKAMGKASWQHEADHLSKVAQLKRMFEMPANEDNEQVASEKKDKSFKPIFVKHNRKENSSNIGLDFSSYFSYYNILRTSQYLAQAFTPLGVAMIAGGMFNKGENINATATDAPEGVSGNAPLLNGNLNHNNYEALDTFLKGEAVVLTSILGLRTAQEFGAVLQNCRLGLSAEFGKPKEDVSFIDLFHSENPVIAIERNRMLGKAFSRLGSSLPFAFGCPNNIGENNGMRLLPGLVGSALNIGMERTIFYKRTPYDILVQTVIDVQSNGLSGDVAKDNLVNDFQRAMQSAFHTMGQNEIAKKDFDELYPVLTLLAEDVIQRKFGIESVIPIIGGGVVVLGDPEQSMANYLYVREHMIEGVAADAIAQKQDNPSIQLAEIIYRQGGEHVTPEIATTARPGYLQMERDRLQEQQFFNSGLSR